VQEQLLTDAAQVAGRDAVITALQRPMKQQIENAKSNVEEIVKEISATRTPTVGFNAYNRRVEDLLSAGVVDPTKLVLQSMRIAFAHARVILQTGAWAFSPEDEKTLPTVAPMGDLS
jgi:chaperonin GroEL